MRSYQVVRNWVDHMLGKEGVRSRGVLFPAFPPLFLPAIFEPNWFVWTLVAALSSGWFAFVSWRGWRMMKATAARGDRAYDREGKFKLAKEYSSTESTTAAKRGRRA